MRSASATLISSTRGPARPGRRGCRGRSSRAAPGGPACARQRGADRHRGLERSDLGGDRPTRADGQDRAGQGEHHHPGPGGPVAAARRPLPGVRRPPPAAAGSPSARQAPPGAPARRHCHARPRKRSDRAGPCAHPRCSDSSRRSAVFVVCCQALRWPGLLGVGGDEAVAPSGSTVSATVSLVRSGDIPSRGLDGRRADRSVTAARDCPARPTTSGRACARCSFDWLANQQPAASPKASPVLNFMDHRVPTIVGRHAWYTSVRQHGMYRGSAAGPADAVLDHVSDGADVIVPLANGEPVSVIDALEAGAGGRRFAACASTRCTPARPALPARDDARHLLHVSYFLSHVTRPCVPRGRLRAGAQPLQRGAPAAARDHQVLAGGGGRRADGPPRLLLARHQLRLRRAVHRPGSVLPRGQRPHAPHVRAQPGPRQPGGGWTEVDRPLVEVSRPVPPARSTTPSPPTWPSGCPTAPPCRRASAASPTPCSSTSAATATSASTPSCCPTA